MRPRTTPLFCFDNAVAMDEGVAWLARSLAIEKAHSNLALRAPWLWKDGKKKETAAKS